MIRSAAEFPVPVVRPYPSANEGESTAAYLERIGDYERDMRKDDRR